jgi:hypothetical protein
MDINRGLVKCNLPIGHHDAFVHVFGWLKACPEADVQEEMYLAFCNADEHHYAIPEIVHQWLIEYADRTPPPPF